MRSEDEQARSVYALRFALRRRREQALFLLFLHPQVDVACFAASSDELSRGHVDKHLGQKTPGKAKA